MITGWLVKVVLGIALFGFACVELGGPLVVRAQLDSVAHDAIDAAGFAIRDGGNEAVARAAAVERASQDGAEVIEFRVDEQRRAHVTVRKHAKSYLLEKWDRAKSWYDVTVSASTEEKP